MSTAAPRAGSGPRARRVPRALRALVRDVSRSTRGHDLALYAAGVTFYAAIGFVPLLLLSLYLAGLLVGADTLRALSTSLVGLLPRGLGAQDAGRALAEAGAGLSAPQALAALLPASLYGEGLVRAFDRLSGDAPTGPRGLRGRLASLALLAVTPLLLLAGLAASRGLTRALGDSLPDRLLGVYCAFLIGWLVISVLLVLSYWTIARGGCGTRALLWGALSTGSMLSGTCLGFVLFLSLPLDLGAAFGGSDVLAIAVATLGWIYLLHVVVLVGYVLTLRLEARAGHPLRAATGPDLVRAA